jgi:prepilin-type N-terminal cleavage/methylation domain-containing protein
MSYWPKRARRGFTLIEILVVVAIVGLLATILVPVFNTIRAEGQLMTARQQAKGLQTALDGWLLAQPSNYAAHASYNSSGGDNPADTGAFLALLSPYMDPASQSLFTLQSAGSYQITTPIMTENGWYLVIVWPAASWTSSHPSIAFYGPP